MKLLKLDIQYFASSGSSSVAVTSYDTLKFTWSQSSQSVANNTTTISWKLQLVASNYGYISSSASKSWSVTVNGTKYSGTNTVGISNNSTKTLASGTTTIKHNNDGTKTFSYSFSQAFAITFSGSYIGTKSGSGSGTLNTIKRASVLGTISNFTLGNAISIPITKYVSSFTDSLTISVAGTTIKTVNGITNGTKVSFTEAELTKIYGLLPSATTGTFTFKLTTKNGSTSVGTSSKTATGTIPTNITPTISSVTIAEAGEVPEVWGIYVQNKSKIKFVVSASAGTGSSVSSVKTTINGSTYTGTDITTNLIDVSGDLTATITVTDKRNRTATTTKTIKVLEYDNPYVTTFNVFRCDVDGNASDTGTYLYVGLKGGVYPLNGKNTASYSIEYKKTTEDEYTKYTFDSTELEIDSYTIISGIESASSYNVKANITDYFITQSKNGPIISSAFRTVHYKTGGRGMAVGKMAEEENTFDVAFQTKLTGGLKPIFLEAETDLNDVRTPNFYTGQNITNYEYSNCPLTSGTFYLEVVSCGEDGQVRQVITSCHKTDSVMYERFYYQSEWGEWQKKYGYPANNVIVDYTFTNSTTNSKTFDIELLPNEIYDIRIVGGTTANADIYTYVNEVETGYYQLARFGSGELTANGNITQTYGYRHNSTCFYYTHSMKIDHSIIESQLTLDYSVANKKYYPHYKWKTMTIFSGMQLDSDGYGWLNSACTSITKIRFMAYNSNFKEGTRIVIKRRVD